MADHAFKVEDEIMLESVDFRTCSIGLGTYMSHGQFEFCYQFAVEFTAQLLRRMHHTFTESEIQGIHDMVKNDPSQRTVKQRLKDALSSKQPVETSPLQRQLRVKEVAAHLYKAFRVDWAYYFSTFDKIQHATVHPTTNTDTGVVTENQLLNRDRIPLLVNMLHRLKKEVTHLDDSTYKQTFVGWLDDILWCYSMVTPTH